MKNRLNLDFTLQTSAERKKFVDEYIKNNNIQFTPQEIETMSNYILWGKEEDGKNVVQKKLVEIDTKHTTWSNRRSVESLETLMDNPSFDENSLQKVGTFIPTKTKKPTFDRTEALQKAPESMRPVFEQLFEQIDELDLKICFYELDNGKRTKPPRADLCKKFAPDRLEQIHQAAANMNQRTYLRARHQLVELRTVQYTLRDSYAFAVQRESKSHIKTESAPAMFGEDVFVLPLGLDTKKGVAKLVFSDTAATINWTEKELKKVSDFMWEQKQKDPLPEFYFDFRELEHVYQLLLAQEDLEAELAAIGDFDNSLRPLLDTLEFYAAAAHLDPIHREILDMKVRKVRNEEVAAAVNGKYGKSYTPNYISTIFRHKIIKEINEAAKHHLEIMENVFFPENFRYCTKCGEYMLKSPHNFVRKTKSADGYTGRCKRCDKVVRANKQGGGGEKNGQ